MGVRLLVEVLDHYHGPDARKLWLLAFAESASDRTREGWPGRALLAARTGRSASRTSNIATELAREGVIDRLGGGNRGGSERYALRPLAPASKSSLRTNSSDPSKGSSRANPKPRVKGSESGKKGSASSSQPAETSSSNPSVKQPSKTSPSRKREEYDDPRFAEFWDAYPRRVDKRKAWRAWQAAIRRGADPAAITASAARYADERRGRDAKYTKHPASWLNAESYANEPAVQSADVVEVEDNGWLMGSEDNSWLTD